MKSLDNHSLNSSFKKSRSYSNSLANISAEKNQKYYNYISYKSK